MTFKRIVMMFHPTDLSQADWVIFAESGELLHTQINGALKNLAETADNADVTVLVPTEDVLLTQVTLPKLARAKLLQALPFALEEQLIADVSELHFAIGKHQADDSLPVAIVAKTKMQNWLDALKVAEITPNYMFPSVFALPYSENHWRVYSGDNINIVRTAKYSGFAADTETTEQLLELKLSQVPDKNAVTITRLPDNHHSFLSHLAATIDHDELINLLQPPFATKRKTVLTKNVWRYAGYAAAAWIVFTLFSNLISFFILHHQASKINSEIETIYHHNFPKATSVTAPRERMESKLKELTRASQKNNFLSLIAAVGKSLTEVSGVRLQNMDYRSGQLTLEVTAATFDNLDSLQQSLNQQGLNVKQQNAAAAGTQTKATLIINAGGV